MECTKTSTQIHTYKHTPPAAALGHQWPNRVMKTLGPSPLHPKASNPPLGSLGSPVPKPLMGQRQAHGSNHRETESAGSLIAARAGGP